MILATFSQVASSPQLPQVSWCRATAQFRMGQSDPLYGVFSPGIRHPVQWIISGVISTLFHSDQSFATLRRSSSSWLTVAMRASHVSQFNPQQAMKSFMGVSS